MKVKKEYMLAEAVVVEVFCDRCGKPLHVQGLHEPPLTLIYQSHLSVDQYWGFFSKKDGERHHFDLCEECYDLTIKTMGILVHTTEYM